MAEATAQVENATEAWPETTTAIEGRLLARWETGEDRAEVQASIGEIVFLHLAVGPTSLEERVAGCLPR